VSRRQSESTVSDGYPPRDTLFPAPARTVKRNNPTQQNQIGFFLSSRMASGRKEQPAQSIREHGETRK
jgi:hypothetical protein